MTPLLMPVYGTRPEAIKMAPVIAGVLAGDTLDMSVVVTGQHREMLDQVNELFAIVPDRDMDIFQAGQSLEDITVRTIRGLSGVLKQVRPDAVLVQGDTTSAFAAALAAFYQQIPVFHLEAGLRTADPLSPFPEEMNRRLTGRLTALHLAPTPASRANLLREGVAPDTIVVTGNTVIDALLSTVARGTSYDDPAVSRAAASDRRIVLVTTHRRESWGPAMEGVGRAVARLAHEQPDLLFIVPLHGNPIVRDALLPALDPLPNVVLTGSLPYAQFARLIDRSTLILTDSGGIQEEAPSLGKPVLVLRQNTERPEAVEYGTVKLVGTDEERIVSEALALLTDPARYAAMANAVNPYGDGRAAARSIAAFESYFGIGERLPDFSPAGSHVLR